MYEEKKREEGGGEEVKRKKVESVKETREETVSTFCCYTQTYSHRQRPFGAQIQNV